MSSIASIASPLSPSASTVSAPAPTTAPKKQALGQDDFLKLLAVQFQSQDPMKPMDDTAFISQMAQFTALDQSQTLTQQMTQLRANQDLATANSYLGRQLTVDDGNGGTVSGLATAVDASGSAPRVIVNGQSYALSTVLRVEPGSISTPSPTPANPGGA